MPKRLALCRKSNMRKAHSLLFLHPPGVRKGFIKGEALRLLRTNPSVKSFVENITQFKTRLCARDYPRSLVERITREPEVKLSETKSALPCVTTYHPALPNFKNILMSKWHLIKNQPLQREIYKHISTSI